MRRIAVNNTVGSMILIALFLSGCGDNLPTQPGASVIMPLKVGNMWIGRMTTYDKDGNVLASGPDTLTVLNTSTYLFDDKEVFYQIKGGIFQGNTCTNRSDGLYFIQWYTNPLHTYLDAKYPASPLDTFDSSEVYRVSSKVYSVSETVTVPAGTFRCYHYAPILASEDTHPMLVEHRYFVPDLGPILIDQYQYQNTGTDEYLWHRRWELVKAVLK